MLRLGIRLAALVYRLLRTYAPTNILLDALRTRAGLKWTIPVAVVLVPAYLLGVRLVTVWIEQGGPGWLHLIALTLAWSAIKFTLMIPVSLALLAKARINQRRARNQWGRGIGGYEPGHSAGAWTTLP